MDAKNIFIACQRYQHLMQWELKDGTGYQYIGLEEDYKNRPHIILLNEKSRDTSRLHSCDPVGTRTQDPYIKSVLLYQLSYGIITRL